MVTLSRELESLSYAAGLFITLEDINKFFSKWDKSKNKA